MYASSPTLEETRPDSRTAFHTQLLDAVGRAVIATDLDGTITYWNRAAEALYGWTSDEVLGRNVLDVTTPQATQAQTQEIMDSLAAGTSWTGEFLVKRQDGSTFPAHVTDTPLYDEEGRLIGIVGISSDISAQKEMECAVQQSEARFRGLVHNTSEIITLLAADGTIQYQSPSITRLLGYAPEDLEQTSVFNIIHPDDRANTQSVLERVLEKGGDSICELRVLAKCGEWRWFESTATNLFHDPAVGAIVVSSRDINGRKRYETELCQRDTLLQDREERLRLALEAAQMGTWDWDLLENTVVSSPHMDRMFGVAEGGFNGPQELFGSMIGPDDRKEVKRQAQIAVEKGKDLNVEFRIERPDGEMRWIHSKGRVYRDPDGVPRRMIGTVQDATERKRQEEALRASEAEAKRLAVVASRTSHGVVITDPQDRVVWVNDGFTRKTGYTLAEILGKHPAEFLSGPASDPATGAFIGQKANNRQPFSVEMVGYRKSGEPYWVQLDGQPLFDDTGFIGYMAIDTDITERRQYEQQLIEAKERAEQMVRLKDSFLANMSHEIRTPLTSIIGFSDIMAEEAIGEVRSMAQIIRTGGERLMMTLDSVLDLAQLESGSLKLAPLDADVVAEIRELLPLFTRHAEDRGLYLTFEHAEPELLATLDKGALSRILTNLLANAVKFTHAGGVAVRLSRTDSHIEIQVADTGIGMDPSFMAKMFDDFKQESEGVARTYEGVGLGLAITKRLVGLMQGSISAESEKDAGTVFNILLPYQPVQRRDVFASDPDVGAGPVRPKVLVVEDQEDTRLLLDRLLAARYDVTLVANAAETMEAAARERFGLVLMDINLGEAVSGQEALADLRRRPEYAAVPVVACTAYALPGDEERFIASGFDGYLAKPFKKKALLGLLATLLC